jgi:hypothetical protein
VTSFQHGDRVRVQSTGDDGFPLIRYGFVGGAAGDGEPVVVMLDDELRGSMVVDLSQIQPVTVTTVELRLDGSDLLHDPALRQGLVNLWHAEAEQAGLEIDSIHPIHSGPIGSSPIDSAHMRSGARDSSEGYALAELVTGGEHYVLRAVCEPNESDVVRVRADRHTRWET